MKTNVSIDSIPLREQPASDRLFLGELQVTDCPLLDLDAERRLGRRLAAALGRLGRLAPLDLGIAERLLERLARAASGRTWIASWGRDHARQRADLERARWLLRELRTTRDAAERGAFRRELALLFHAYPLEPEVLIEWAFDVTASVSRESGDPDRDDSQRIAALLRRLVERVVTTRDELALANTRLVLREVLRHRPSGITRSDLFQEGFLGVQRAALRYDPERNLRFSTYAVFWVKQSVRQGLMNKSKLVRVPERAQTQLRDHRIGRMTPLSHEEAERIASVMHRTVFLSAVESRADGDTFEFEAPVPQPVMDEAKLAKELTGKLSELEPRERAILERRFGLRGKGRETLEAIGRRLRLSRERVRQIEKRALERLRRSVELRSLFDECADPA